MKAIYLTDSGQATEQEEVPAPTPASGEIQVQVFAAAVTPTEVGWYPTRHSKNGQLRERPILGHEFSGVVSAVGRDVTSVAVGDEVFGLNDWFADGAMAEYCVTLPCSIAPKPYRLSHVESASVPISALTAWQGLFERVNLLAGDRILVQGGAGAVGVFAVQLARHAGAYVVTTASPRNFEFLRELGADEVVDYRTDYFNGREETFDAIFDVVGGATLERSRSLLKPKGQVVTVASESGTSTDERTKRDFMLVEANQRHLLEIAAMLDTGGLRAVVDTVVAFNKASDAFAERLSERRGRGKVVVEIRRAVKAASAQPA